MKRAFLGLGSNLGDREAHLREALRRLESPRCRVVRVSSIYETAPRDLLAQPWFLNLVVEVETSLYPMMLLAHCLKIERIMGRRRTTPKGPRTIDIDILLYGQFKIGAAKLTVPHPRLHERRFVLEPLAELAADFTHPGLRQSVRELLAGVKGQSLRLWQPALPDLPPTGGATSPRPGRPSTSQSRS